MIEITPTDKQIKEARLSAGGTVGLQGSITRGAGSPAGALGEIIVRDLLGYRQINTADYDLYTDQGIRIDVKTKRCTSAPRPFYECSITAHGKDQKCDEYIFLRVLNNLRKAWVLGRIPKDEYFAKAKRHNRGDKDVSNNFIFKSDCYNLPISELWKIEQDCTPSQSASTETQT